MGLTYEPNSLIERRMEYERKRREVAEEEAAREGERFRLCGGELRSEGGPLLAR